MLNQKCKIYNIYNKLVGHHSEYFRNNEKQVEGIKRMQFNATLFQTVFVLTKKVTDKLSEENY